jgi:hypothetical protein
MPAYGQALAYVLFLLFPNDGGIETSPGAANPSFHSAIAEATPIVQIASFSFSVLWLVVYDSVLNAVSHDLRVVLQPRLLQNPRTIRADGFNAQR